MKKPELRQLIREEVKKALKEDGEHYMFFENLKIIKKAVDEMLNLDKQMVDDILSDGHDWAEDHMATSKDDVEEVYNFLIHKKHQLDLLTLLLYKQIRKNKNLASIILFYIFKVYESYRRQNLISPS